LELQRKGGKGLLLSGGCDLDGRVDYPAHILEGIRAVKQKTSLIVNVHPGIVDADEARSLADAGVDVFSYDLVMDQNVLQGVMHLDITPEDVARSYHALLATGVRTVPHILAGLGGPIGKCERDALQVIATSKADMAVLIIHIPTRMTPMESVPAPEDGEVMAFAREMVGTLPGKDLILGCMRPRGRSDLETSILMAGFTGIVQPSSSTVRALKAQGADLRVVNACCAALPLIR